MSDRSAGVNMDNVSQNTETAWLLPFLQLAEKYDFLHNLVHRCSGEWAPVTFLVTLNDRFVWGCADSEPIRSLDDVVELEKAITDCMTVSPPKDANEWHSNVSWGEVIYACRKRKSRLQGIAYPRDTKLWPLIDACGPEREIDVGNPCRPGEDIY
jgi:hypothetical protein